MVTLDEILGEDPKIDIVKQVLDEPTDNILTATGKGLFQFVKGIPERAEKASFVLAQNIANLQERLTGVEPIRGEFKESTPIRLLREKLPDFSEDISRMTGANKTAADVGAALGIIGEQVGLSATGGKLAALGGLVVDQVGRQFEDSERMIDKIKQDNPEINPKQLDDKWDKITAGKNAVFGAASGLVEQVGNLLPIKSLGAQKFIKRGIQFLGGLAGETVEEIAQTGISDFSLNKSMDELTEAFPGLKTEKVESDLVEVAKQAATVSGILQTILGVGGAARRSIGGIVKSTPTVEPQKSYIVLDKEGEPLTLFHGTDEKFDVFQTKGGEFKTKGTGSFFTSDEKIAQTYGKDIKKVNLEFQKPFVVDFGDQNWQAGTAKDIKVEDKNMNLAEFLKLDNIFKDFSTDELVRKAKELGEYDSVIMKNVRDLGPRLVKDVGLTTPSDIYVAFDEKQIKRPVEQGLPQVEQQIPQQQYELNRQTEIKKPSDFRDLAVSIFQPISTTLRKINPKLSDSLRKFEFNILNNVRKDFENTKGFLTGMNKISENDFQDLDLALKNKDEGKVNEILNRNNLSEEFTKMRTTLDGIFDRAKDSGMDIQYLSDYFPRKVKNPPEFLAYLRGTEQWTAIEEAINSEEQKSGILSDEDRARIANSLLRGIPKGRVLLREPGEIKERSIEKVTPELNKFYEKSPQTIVGYIESMNASIEAMKIFGKSDSSIKDSIGSYVNQLIDRGVMTRKDEQKVRNVLQARFNEKGPGNTVRLFKNMAYMYTLNNPGNAITQIGDLAWSMFENGFFRTAKALIGKKAVKKEDIGIDAVSEEFTGREKSAKAVSALFKTIGLAKMDAIGKETFINASLEKLSRQAKKNVPELRKEIARVFGEDSVENVMEDFRMKNGTDEVKYMLFSKLADFQPISMSEMPEQYIKGGNARIFYMLKSFTIKQIDTLRREINEQMRTDPKKGLRNLIKLSSVFVLMGATSDMLKNLLFNRKTEVSDLMIDNMLKLLGFSKWQIYQSRKDGLLKTAMMTILPPVPFVDDVYKDTVKALNNGEVDVKKLKTLRGMPLIGKMYYWWFGGGRDITEKKAKRQRRLIRR